MVLSSSKATTTTMAVVLMTMIMSGLVLGQQPPSECTLNCPNDAPCRFGHADFSGHVVELEAHRNNMHCDCPMGWTGVLCDKKFETCDNQAGHECFHGGACIPGLQDRYGNPQLFCDCSDAVSPIDGTRYVGKYCETPFEQICNSNNNGGGEQEEEEIFCVNGGECNPNFPDLEPLPCICDDGWEGYHCEFQRGSVPDCTLDCQHGGLCIIGVFTPSEAQHMTNSHVWNLEQKEHHMRCMCPEGYGGYLCEAPSQTCNVASSHHQEEEQDEDEFSTGGNSSKNDHMMCLNGGTCVTTTQVNPVTGESKTQQHCDCTVATDVRGNRVAGKYCEHAATSICDEDDFNLFCTQGGTCKDNPIEGCSCPTGTAGYKCEFIIGNIGNGGTGGGNLIGDDDLEDDENDDADDADGPVFPQPTVCGDAVCQNGGICVVQDVVLEDGTRGTEDICDCSEAYNDDTVFAGPFCQYQATSFCLDGEVPSDGLAGLPFCVHHGECQEDASCDCPNGWTGEHCELQTLERGEDPFDEVNEGGDDGTVACGDTVCYNGGACVETEMISPNGGTELVTHCDCATAYDDHFLYAGVSCEFPSTQLCSLLTDTGSLQGSVFCTNHGKCQENIQMGCDCPDGFYGFACEFERLNDEDGDGIPNDEDEDFESIIDDFDVCGDEGLICHNGGNCMTVVVNNDETGDTETSHQCDCSEAFQGNTPFLGIQCEYPATATCSSQSDLDDSLLDVFCVNGGTCKEDPTAGCTCPAGFTGLFCQFKSSTNEIVNNDNVDYEQCGEDLVCLNGGTCVTTIVASLSGEQSDVMHCDCSSAFSDQDVFAGESCEHKATTLCTVGTNGMEGVQFCTNAGTCRNNHLEGCICDPAWDGLHCEFAADADNFVKDDDGGFGVPEDDILGCDLQCHNGGMCAHGVKDLGRLKDVVSGVSHLNGTFSDVHFAHCVCPDGWVGLTCDHKIEVCGDDEHVCLHGSKCVEKNGRHECDCAEADEDIIGSSGRTFGTFAGDSCQHVATDICNSRGTPYPGQPLYFCVNSGKCNAYVGENADNPGCTCPDMWTGSHCEVSVQSFQTNSQKGNGRSEIGPIIGIVVAALVAILAVLVIVMRFVGTKKAGPEEPTKNPHSFPRRRRRAGFGGAPNLAPTHRSALVEGNGSNSDPMAIGMKLPPDDEPDAFHDESDGILSEPESIEQSEDEMPQDDHVMVDAGPPRDDDGHQLHSVDFV